MLKSFARGGGAGALLSLVLAATAGAHLSPMPSVCTGEPNPGCIEKGGGGNVTVSPTLAHVGDVLTIKLKSIKAQYGGVVSWSISSRATGPSSSSPSLKLLGCKPTRQGPLGNGTALCRYRVLSSGRDGRPGWRPSTSSTAALPPSARPPGAWCRRAPTSRDTCEAWPVSGASRGRRSSASV